MRKLLLLLACATAASAQTYTISTVAGGGPGLGLPATGIGINSPSGVTTDQLGNTYVAASQANQVYIFDRNFTLIQIVGNGIEGFSGDGGPAANAQLEGPWSVAVDPGGNLFIAERYDNRIRRVDAQTHIITTVAGNGTFGFSGDGGPAINAELAGPISVSVDPNGNLLIADSENCRVRKVDVQTGIITTVVGTGTGGFSGDGGPATSAQVEAGLGLAVDGAGNLFIADTFNYRIRRVDVQTGIITTVVGTGTYGFSGDGGPAISAQLGVPQGVVVDAAGNLYIADANLRRVDSQTGIITTVAGNGTSGFSGDNGPATSAELFYPQGVGLDSFGNVLIADTTNNRIRRVASGIISTVAGNGNANFGGDGFPGVNAQLFFPYGTAVDPSGNLLIADTSNDRIRRLDAQTGNIATVAGNGTCCFSGDGGLASSAQLYSPNGVAVDANGNLFFADTDNNRVRRVDALTGIITTVAGTGTVGSSGDGGPAISAQLYFPLSVAADGKGNLFIADSYRVRRVDAGTGNIVTVAGTGYRGFSGDGGPATSAQIDDPLALALNSAGDLFITTNDNRIRKVDALTGIMTTVAGNGTAGYSGDGGPAISAQLYEPWGVAVDTTGNLLIADTRNWVIRKVDSQTGIITTVLGNGTQGFSGDGGPATSAEFSWPEGLAIDNFGNIFIADSANQRIRKATLCVPVVTLSTKSISFGSQLLNTISGPQNITLTNSGTAALNITNLTLTGSNANEFSQTSTCGASLAVKASCTVAVTFTPAGLGSRSASLIITDNAAGSPRSVALSGTGVVPLASLSPTALTFAGQPTGSTSASQMITLTNPGGAPLAIASIAILGTNAGDFARSTNCGSALPAGSSCSVSVTFAPTVAGARSATLTITDNAAGSPQSVALSGTGVVPLASLNPTALTFTSQPTGSTSASQTITLTNPGGASLAIASIAISGINAGDFARSTNCGSTLPAGSSCSISVTFAPSAAGARSAMLTVTDNAAGSPQTASLTGTGIATPFVNLSPTVLNFGSQALKTTSAAQTVTLTNTGVLSLSISRINITGDYAQTNNCSKSLAAGASCAIKVTFTPVQAGARTGTLSVTDNAGGSPQSIALSGTGYAPPVVSLSATNLNFGRVAVGTQSGSQSVILSNTGGSTLLISSLSITGVNAADFAQTNTCGTSVAAGSSCTIALTFKPALTGSRSAAVTIGDNAVNNPQSISLTGTGK